MKHQRMLGAMMQKGVRGKRGGYGSANRFQKRGIDKTLARRKREMIARRQSQPSGGFSNPFRGRGFEQFDRYEEPQQGGLGGLLGGLFGGGRDRQPEPYYQQQPRQQQGGGMLGGLARLGALGVVAGVAAGAVNHIMAQRREASQQPPQPTYQPPPAQPAYQAPAPQPAYQPAPPPPPTYQAPSAPAAPAYPTAPAAAQDDPEELAKLLLGAMAAAAEADGQIDAKERADIIAQVQQHGASEEDMAALNAILASPPSMEDLVVAVGDDAELAAQVYAAALLGIEVDTPAEQAWLQFLAARLQIPATAVQQLHQDSGVAGPVA